MCAQPRVTPPEASLIQYGKRKLWRSPARKEASDLKPSVFVQRSGKPEEPRPVQASGAKPVSQAHWRAHNTTDRVFQSTRRRDTGEPPDTTYRTGCYFGLNGGGPCRVVGPELPGPVGRVRWVPRPLAGEGEIIWSVPHLAVGLCA